MGQEDQDELQRTLRLFLFVSVFSCQCRLQMEFILSLLSIPPILSWRFSSSADYWVETLSGRATAS